MCFILLCLRFTPLPTEGCSWLWEQVGNGGYGWESCCTCCRVLLCSVALGTGPRWALHSPMHSRRWAPNTSLLLLPGASNSASPLPPTRNPSRLLQAFSPAVIRVMVQEPQNREASQVPAQGKGEHTALGSSRNLSKRADQHLRCYVEPVPQGGQFFKLRTPQAMKINGSHDLPSIKGN